MLAHHYYEAARPADADLAWPGEEGELSQLAANAPSRGSSGPRALAVSRYELDDALVMLERALELEDDPQRQGRLWRIVGQGECACATTAIRSSTR